MGELARWWWVALLAGARGDDGKFHCVRLEGQLYCIEAEKPDLKEHPGMIWTTAYGIGPAKSGSTSLAGRLRQLQHDVSVGNKFFAEGKPGKHFEVNYLLNNMAMRGGLGALARNFDTSFFDENAPVAAYEKSPSASAHPLVPYRARAFLSKDLKLVLTTRDVIGLDSSYYLYSEQPSHNVTYKTRVEAQVKQNADFHECRIREFRNIMLPNTQGVVPSIDVLYDGSFSWTEAHQVDSVLYTKCSKPEDGIAALEPDLIPNTLRRWMLVFPNRSNILCLDLAQREGDDADKTNIQLFNFLGIDLSERTGVGVKGGQQHHDTALQRIVDSQQDAGFPPPPGKTWEEEVTELFALINDTVVKYVPCSNVAFFKDVCGYAPYGYDHCHV